MNTELSHYTDKEPRKLDRYGSMASVPEHPSEIYAEYHHERIAHKKQTSSSSVVNLKSAKQKQRRSSQQLLKDKLKEQDAENERLQRQLEE